MKYRELQAAVKAAGLNAKGSKAELEERWAMAKPSSPVVQYEPVKAEKSGVRQFVFIGDPRGDGTSNPERCYMHGCLFKLNGAAVKVNDDIAAKLATHSHFTEK